MVNINVIWNKKRRKGRLQLHTELHKGHCFYKNNIEDLTTLGLLQVWVEIYSLLKFTKHMTWDCFSNGSVKIVCDGDKLRKKI